MRIAVLSDIHDNVWNLEAALHAARGADAMVCCGDLCSPFVMHQLGRGFSGPLHVVFGNNDADLFRITAAASAYPQVRLHGELFRGEFAGRRAAAQHFDSIALPLAASGEFDVVFYGHNHTWDVSRPEGSALRVNPGSIMGAAFGAAGARIDTAATFAIYDAAAGAVTRFELGPNGFRQS